MRRADRMGGMDVYTLCLLHKLAKKSVMIIVDRRMDRNFSYAGKKVLSGETLQPVPAQ